MASLSEFVRIYRKTSSFELNQTLSFGTGPKKVELIDELLLITVETETKAYIYKDDGDSFSKAKEISLLAFPFDISLSPNK